MKNTTVSHKTMAGVIFTQKQAYYATNQCSPIHKPMTLMIWFFLVNQKPVTSVASETNDSYMPVIFLMSNSARWESETLYNLLQNLNRIRTDY